MTTHAAVPERPTLAAGDAWRALRHGGAGTVARATFDRFRDADGFSHARALGFQLTLTAIPAVIAAIGLASVLDHPSWKRLLQQVLLGLAPGPAGGLLKDAFRQGANGGSSALWVGLLAAALSGTVAMALVERGANRIYGLDEDRATARRYGLAFLLACSAGILMLLGFVLFIMGRTIAEAGQGSGWSEGTVTAWRIARWPLAVVCVVIAFSLLFKVAPRRVQPRVSWLLVASGLSVALWVLFTAVLSFYLTLSGTFGQTYGPLSGVLGALLWAYLSSLALFLGFAFAAELETDSGGLG